MWRHTHKTKQNKKSNTITTAAQKAIPHGTDWERRERDRQTESVSSWAEEAEIWGELLKILLNKTSNNFSFPSVCETD